MGALVIRKNSLEPRGLFNNVTQRDLKEKRQASAEQLVFVVGSLLFSSNLLKGDCCGGEGYYISNGAVQKITWSKASEGAYLKFLEF